MSEHLGAAEQLEHVAGAYQSAYAEVQRLLVTTPHPKLPAWVFQLDRFDVKEIAVFSRPLAQAEQNRRKWRAALHATTELAALEVEAPDVRSLSAITVDPDAPLDDLGTAPTDTLALDAFISVVQYARAAGCSYVDGAFQPVSRST